MTRPHLRRAGERGIWLAVELLALAGLLVAAVALLVHAIPTSVQTLVVLASGAHVAMWTAPLALVLGLALRRWFTSAAAAVLTALVLVLQVPPLIATTAPAHARTVVVMQSNLKLGEADPARIVALVREHHVDVLATEELTPSELVGLLRAGLTTQLRYHFNEPIPGGAGGIGLWSRYPISDPVDVPGFHLGLRHARVALPGAPFTFVSLHMDAPYPQPADAWRADFQRLPGILDALPHDAPVVVAGDFNATVDHAPFRDVLEHGYADGAAQAGAGYPASYPNDRWDGPLIAIDHVLTRDAVATSLDTYGVDGSDHRTLIARVAVPQTGT